VLVDKAGEYISFPSTNERMNKIKAAFYNSGKISNVIGLVDGTHINIKAPKQNEQVYVNRKQKHSINVQVICDNEYRITDLNASFPGSCHDSFVFKNSSIYDRFEGGEFGNSILIGTFYLSLESGTVESIIGAD
jgi:hypothetical protein